MNTPSIAAAQDLVAFADRTLERLRAARTELEAEPSFDDERRWLDEAVRRVSEGVSRTQAALEGAVLLPELAAARKAKTERLLTAWVEALERLLAGTLHHASASAPILEVLFPHQNLAVLRRSPTQAQAYSSEFQRRADSAYVRRICADPEYSFLPPLVGAARTAHASWRDCTGATPPSEESAATLRREVLIAADALDLALRQARALSEAALAGDPARLVELGLDAKPRRRALTDTAVRTQSQP